MVLHLLRRQRILPTTIHMDPTQPRQTHSRAAVTIHTLLIHQRQTRHLHPHPATILMDLSLPLVMPTDLLLRRAIPMELRDLGRPTFRKL